MVHKHAYLILAHSQFNQLAFLVSLLDHQDNDILSILIRNQILMIIFWI